MRRWTISGVFLGVVSLFLASAEAAEISLVQAETAAGNWLVRNRRPLNADIGTVPTGGTTYRDAAGTALFHVVKIVGGGFIVTSADDGISPIVAISESDDLVEDTNNGLWVLLNKDMANRQLALSVDRTTTSSLLLAAAAVATPSQGSPEAEWAKLLDESSFSIQRLSSINDVRVSPLVKSTWDQDTVPSSSKYTYNYYTPNHYVCGCVATAMSQLMRYHQFPTASRSVVTKTCYVSDVATSLSTKAGTYAWSNMPLTPDYLITDIQREAIGRLTYDAGVSVRMQYDTTANGGSGAYTLECADALKNTFGYANGMSHTPSTFTTNVINRAVLANLDGGYPILLGITGTPGGHAIVGDGYGYSSSKLYVHLNMGWSGDQNAWYNLPTIDTAYGTFSTISTIVYNVYTNGTGDLITGRIFDESGAAITGATVRAYQNNTLNATSVTGTNGVYALRVTISGSSATFTIVASNSYLAATSSVTVAKSVMMTYHSSGQALYVDSDGTVGNSWGNDMVLTPTSLPTAPTAVSATDGAYSNAVVVTWSGATSAASYSVWRGGNESSASALLIASDITEQTYSDTSAAFGAGYFYWIKATNSLGSSGLSTAKDSGYIALAAPLNVSASDGTRTDGVLVTWSAVPNATQYCLFRATNDVDTPAQSSSWTAGLCVTNTSAVAGTTYYYYVKAALNKTYPGFLSAYDTGYRALAAPTGVSATDGTSTNLITISWSTVSGATSYEVWRGTTSSSASATSLATGISTTPYADSTASPAVRYYYWVKAVNSSGTSDFSSSDTGYLGLSSPAAVSATDGTSTTMVTVTWTAAPGAGSNEVWRGTTASPASATSLAAGITAATYSDTTVVPGTLYYYWVKAVNEVATSAFSGSNTGYRALSAPTAVSASDGSSTTEVTVTWTGATGAASNEVWRGTTANPASATRLVTGITAATYSDTTAVPGTLYTYWTKAVTAISTSTLSGSNTGYRALSAPTAVSASDGTTTNGVIVTWGAVTGASYYQVSRADTLAGTKTVLGSWQTALIYTNTTALAMTNYYYFVTAAVDGSGGYGSAYSAGDVGYRALPVPAAPTGVSATDGTSTNLITVSWTAVSGASSYEVWRGTTSSSASATSLATGVSALTYSDSTASPGTRYYYWLKAVNTSGSSSFSASDTGYLGLSSPTAVSATDGTSTTTVTVTWTAATGAVSNEVWRGTTANPASATSLATGITTTTYSDTSANPGVLYFYWLKAVNVVSTSAFSGSNTGYRALSAPTGVSASDGTTTNGVIVTWSTVTGASYYRVSRAATAVGAKTELGTWQTALTYTDASSVAGSNYYYFVVAAVDGSGGYASASSTYDIGYRQVASFGTSTSPVSVPYAWLDSYALVTAGNYEAAANFDSDQDGADAWEEYVAGTVPTNGASVFRSRISLVNGVPVVDWTPDLGVSRTYTLYGKTNLQDAVWFAPTNSGVRFFRVKVDMK